MNQNATLFIQQNTFQNVICKTADILFWPQWFDDITSKCHFSMMITLSLYNVLHVVFVWRGKWQSTTPWQGSTVTRYQTAKFPGHWNIFAIWDKVCWLSARKILDAQDTFLLKVSLCETPEFEFQYHSADLKYVGCRDIAYRFDVTCYMCSKNMRPWG